MNAKAPLAETVGWTDRDLRAVDTVRVLAADAVAVSATERTRALMSCGCIAPSPETRSTLIAERARTAACA